MRSLEWKNRKFDSAMTTENDGLGVDPHDPQDFLSNQSKHKKMPLFDRATCAYELVQELLRGSPYEHLISCLRVAKSRNPDATSSANSLVLDLQRNSGDMSNESDNFNRKQSDEQSDSGNKVNSQLLIWSNETGYNSDTVRF